MHHRKEGVPKVSLRNLIFKEPLFCSGYTALTKQTAILCGINEKGGCVMKRVTGLILVIIFNAWCINLYSAQTNFQVSVPPVPWYEFCSGQHDLKLNATYIYLSGKLKDPYVNGNLDVRGGGGGGFYRYAFNEFVGFDTGGTLIKADGDIGGNSSMDMEIRSLPADIEFQPVKNDIVSIIMFAGYSFTWFDLGIDIQSGTSRFSMDTVSSMKGPQAGIQAGFKSSGFVIMPFFMVMSLSGDADVDMKYNGFTMPVSSGISSLTSFYCGIDMVYTPWNITLSSIVQQALASGSDEAYRTYVFTVCYHFGTACEKKETGKQMQ